MIRTIRLSREQTLSGLTRRVTHFRMGLVVHSVHVLTVVVVVGRHAPFRSQEYGQQIAARDVTRRVDGVRGFEPMRGLRTVGSGSAHIGMLLDGGIVLVQFVKLLFAALSDVFLKYKKKTLFSYA